MFCTRCGAKNDDGAKFCTACGAPLRPMPASAPTPGGPRCHRWRQQPQQQHRRPRPKHAGKHKPDHTTAHLGIRDAQHRTDTPAPRRRGKKGGLVIAGVAAVAVVAVIAGIAVFLL